MKPLPKHILFQCMLLCSKCKYSVPEKTSLGIFSHKYIMISSDTIGNSLSDSTFFLECQASKIRESYYALHK